VSRSRRRRKLPKCDCGRRRLPRDDAKQRDPIGNCTILDYTDEHNARLRAYRQRRDDLRAEVIPAGIEPASFV
jgi:hypothetical protein